MLLRFSIGGYIISEPVDLKVQMAERLKSAAPKTKL